MRDDILCDSCMIAPKPWLKGRAAVLYDGTGRKLVLGLKHGDRQDLAGPLAGWMVRAGGFVIDENALIAPVPLHWRRFLGRKFNQASLLANEVAKIAGVNCMPDLLRRHRATKKQDGMTREERFKNLRQSVDVPENKQFIVKDRNILLIDDVMTTGATLSACTEAVLHAGAASVNVLVLARVARDA